MYFISNIAQYLVNVNNFDYNYLSFQQKNAVIRQLLERNGGSMIYNGMYRMPLIPFRRSKMKKTRYPIDYSAILYLAQMQPNHSNVYRFALTMRDPICPEHLQKAADRVCARFPTIFSGFRPGLFSCCMVPADAAPRVAEDPGTLRTLSDAELRSCAYRIFYSGNQVIIEAFHALTDGFGAVTSLKALAAEYLHLHHGVHSPERQEMLESGEPDWETELQDAYLDYTQAKGVRLPNRHAYQLRGENRDWNVKVSTEQFSTGMLLGISRRYGVSLTAMLSCLMAEAIMEVQNRHTAPKKKKPVRIMVPIDLRRLFPSRTLRNFILYALPTMECGSILDSRELRMHSFHSQLKQQVSRKVLEDQISANVNTQRLLIFRIIPLKLKLAAMRLAYRFFGESNSSITLTNLGAVTFSDELKQHICGMDVLLTPRCQSPYNCGIISCGETTSISITRFGAQPELETLFYEKLRRVLQ